MIESKYTLIKLVSSVEKEADASNNISVSYITPNIEVIVGGVNEEEAYAALQEIDEEVEFFKAIFTELARIRKNAKNKKALLANVDQYRESVLTSKNEYITKLYLNNYNTWEQIESHIKKISGEFMIIPCFYKSI